MERAHNTLLEELEQQWDLSQEAAEAALNELFDAGELGLDPDLIDEVLITQRQQHDLYRAVKAQRRNRVL